MSQAAEWRQGWKLVVAAMMGFSFFSVMTPAVSLFMQPLTGEFGWTRTQASMGVTISGAVVALLSPFFGVLIDRWGPRRIAVPGLVVAGLSIAAFSLANGSIFQWVILWILYGLASLSVKATVWTAAVAGAFDKARGFAIGLTMAGAGTAQIIAPLLLNTVIETQGWRAAYLWLGLGWGGIAFSFSVFWLVEQKPRGARKAGAVYDSMFTSLPGLSISQAWRDVSLWKIAVSTFVIMTVTVAVLVHQFPILTEAGVTRSHAAQLAALAGGAGIVGKLVTGWLMDRWHARWVSGITILFSSLTFVLLLNADGATDRIMWAMIINGYAAGAKLQVCGYLTTRYGGLRNFGVIFGFMASILALASGIGPIIGGLSYDIYGSYAPLLSGGLASSLIGGLLLLSLGKYPIWGPDSATVRSGMGHSGS